MVNFLAYTFRIIPLDLHLVEENQVLLSAKTYDQSPGPSSGSKESFFFRYRT